MLIQFSVENFKSFKNRAILSLEGSADKDLRENFVPNGNDKYLKAISVFGANAAGKSNLFQALTAAILTIRMSANRQVNEPLIYIIPFKFDEDTIAKPSAFEFVFIAEGKKYVYGFSATSLNITKEYLYVYNSAKPSTIFERDGNVYSFTSPDRKRVMQPLTERNTSNKLFLATATQWNCEETRIPYLWFASGVNTYTASFDQLLLQNAPMFENDTNDSLKRFTTNILHEADINIDDYEFESREQTGEQFLQKLPAELRNLASTVSITSNKEIRIDTMHTVEADGISKQYRLSILEESQGTKNLFAFSPVLKRAFETGETVCIDEFDSSIHPMLIEYLIGLFNNPDINRENAQLIMSTHAVSVMSLKLLRRDQIYFVEKDRKTGASELYSLDEFSPRKQEDVRKAYLLGRYGSVPYIPEEADLWQ
ncbi:MAG: ATP-binding protein [Clostridia bacterium]|nr:ATP-binding protein [Clostridia bacterium]MBO7659574.1 ATP-binding protein [Clostridia bacterium]MBP5664740.1 ATP-binding protein [Clostridia bacterium]MBP5766475.1 ATP-binding protein [Clostridia bacterium]